MQLCGYVFDRQISIGKIGFYLDNDLLVDDSLWGHLWGIERSGFFNGREKWVKGFENQMV